MPRKPRTFFKDVICHIFFRGNQKRLIFRDGTDYKEYIGRLEELSSEEACNTMAYSIMPNHGHIILQQASDNPISHMMQRLQGGFTQHWNKKYDKVGHVFQGRYKALICQDERYLLELIRYIHLNAPKAGLVEKPEEYPWCSHKHYLSPKTDDFLHTDLVKSYFNNEKMFDRFIKSGMKENKSIDEISLSIETAIRRGNNHPLPALSALLDAVSKKTEAKGNMLIDRKKSNKLAASFIKAAKKHGFFVEDIAKFLGISQNSLRRLFKKHS